MSLLTSWRDDGEQGASVDQPLLVSTRVGHVKKKRVTVFADDVIHVAYDAGFPFGALRWGFRMHQSAQFSALSPNLMWKRHTCFLGLLPELE